MSESTEASAESSRWQRTRLFKTWRHYLLARKRTHLIFQYLFFSVLFFWLAYLFGRYVGVASEISAHWIIVPCIVLFVPAFLVPLFSVVPVENMPTVWFKALVFVAYVVGVFLYLIVTLQMHVETFDDNGNRRQCTAVQTYVPEIPILTVECYDAPGSKKDTYEAVVSEINRVFTDIVFSLLAAIVVLIGIWINSKRGDFQRRSEQSFRLIVDSRLSEAFQDRLRDFELGLSPYQPLTKDEAELFRNHNLETYTAKLKAEGNEDLAEDDHRLVRIKAFLAARYMLNYYEFLARGLKEGELTEALLHATLPGIVSSLAAAAYWHVQVEREVNERKSEVYVDFLWLLHRWNLVDSTIAKYEKADYSEMIKGAISAHPALSFQYERADEPLNFALY